MVQNNRDFTAKVLSGYEVSFLKRELGKKNYYDMSVTLGDKRHITSSLHLSKINSLNIKFHSPMWYFGLESRE
jgi:hypothetical protein